jgi:HPt (histidine-containing phosphotransfer) domain-containing protein
MAEKFTFADLSYLESMTTGNNELLIEMIGIFIDQIPEFTDGLQDHLDKGELNALGALAHKAKSSVAVLGMKDLATDLKTLELSAKAGTNPDQYPILVNRFNEQVQTTKTELLAHLKAIS